MKKWTVAVAILAMLILSAVFLHSSGLVQFKPIELSSSQFPQLQTLSLNRKGNQLFTAQNFKGAFDQYVTALQYDPFSAPLHLNIGLTYEFDQTVEQHSEKALSSYQNAFKYSEDGLMKFMALFNQAQLHGKAKKYDLALQAYQEALKLNPASKEVKTNIELLIQAQQQEQQQKNDEGKDGDKKDENQNENKDQSKDSKDGKSPKDDKQDKKPDDKNKDQKNDEPKPEDKKEDQKPEEKPDDKEKEQKEKDQPKTPQKNEKYKPRPFNGEQLSEADVKKILGEIKQQEQKIRSEFNRKDVKEQPRDKDW